jgi:hypothetical protein
MDIKNYLESRPDIKIVTVEERDHLLDHYAYPHRIDYVIAPHSSIYDVVELNTFLNTLLPSIPPEKKIPFKLQKTLGSLIIGHLFYEEIIGSIEQTITITDEEMKKIHRDRLDDVENGVIKMSSPMTRGVSLWVWPDVELAQKHSQKKHPYSGNITYKTVFYNFDQFAKKK